METQEGTIAAVQSKTDELAIVAFVCGIVAITNPFLGLTLGIVAIVFGIKSRSAITVSKGALSGSGLALAGLICGVLSAVYACVYFWFLFLVIVFMCLMPLIAR